MDNLQSDIIILVFSFIILEGGDFNRFAKLLMAWMTRQNTHRIKDVLERLDWEALYQFHQHPFEVTRDQFYGFIGFAVQHNVHQAMFYNSVRNLFLRENVQHNLAVLAHLSGNHFPYLFGYIFFKAIFRTFDRRQTCQEMYDLLNRTEMRTKLVDLIRLFEDMYIYITDKDYLLPIYKFCSNARNPNPIYQLDGHPFGEELWLSLCDKTVEPNFRMEGEFYTKKLKMEHIWRIECQHCATQLILFKILLNSVRD